MPTGLRFHGRDIVTWLHLTVRQAVKCHLKCAQRRDILGAFESEGHVDWKDLKSQAILEPITTFFFFFLSRKTVIWTIYCRGIEHKLIIKNVAWISIRTAIQLLSCVQLFVTPWTAPGFPVLHYFSEFAQTHVH